MFYEERVIEGILHCRNSPDGEWVVVSPENMTLKIERLQSSLTQSQQELERVRGELREAQKRQHQSDLNFDALERLHQSAEAKVKEFESALWERDGCVLVQKEIIVNILSRAKRGKLPSGGPAKWYGLSANHEEICQLEAVLKAAEDK